MGRLIDADNLNFDKQRYNKSQMKAILDFIDSQPTAYDVDKVVEQLENEPSCGFGFKGLYTKRAIEIVREGAVKDE